MNYITLCLSDAGGKLEANWLGPYTVKTVGPNHQAVLEKDGVLLKRKANVGQLKPYLERMFHKGIVNLSGFLICIFSNVFIAFLLVGCCIFLPIVSNTRHEVNFT